MLRKFLTVFGYIFVAALVVVLTIGLVAYGQGYTYNFRDNKLVRTGLVIIQSSPGGLKVAVDGQKPKKKTTFSQAYEPGSHNFSISADGFHTWTKQLPVLAGEVTLVQYATMVPIKPATQTVLTATGLSGVNLSRDHRHVAYLAGGEAPGVYVYNLGDSKPVRVYTPEAAAAATPAETLTSVQWSDDASRLLVVSNVGGTVVTRVMLANGTGAVNLNTQYGQVVSGIKFTSPNGRELAWISPEGLRRLDLDTTTVGAPLATGVSQFEVVTGERIFYVQAVLGAPTLWQLDKNNRKQEVVAALPVSDKYSLAYTNYRGTDALAVVPVSTKVGTLYLNFLGDTPTAQTVAHDATDVTFSPDGHLVAFSGPTGVTAYDLDQSDVFNKPVAYSFATSNLSAAPDWFDNFHFLMRQSGKLMWSEFDGANQVDLGASEVALPPFSSPDGRTVYVFRAGASGATELVALTIKSGSLLGGR